MVQSLSTLVIAAAALGAVSTFAAPVMELNVRQLQALETALTSIIKNEAGKAKDLAKPPPNQGKGSRPFFTVSSVAARELDSDEHVARDLETRQLQALETALTSIIKNEAGKAKDLAKPPPNQGKSSHPVFTISSVAARSNPQTVIPTFLHVTAREMTERDYDDILFEREYEFDELD